MLDRREWLGLVFAPAPLGWSVPVLAMVQIGRELDIFSFLLILQSSLVFGYGPVIVLGLPVHLLLRRADRRDAGSYLVPAGIIGALLGLLPLALTLIAAPDPTNPFAYKFSITHPLVTAALALLSAATFWWVAVRGRTPDWSGQDLSSQ